MRRFHHFFLFGIILSVYQFCSAVLNGDLVEWTRHAYVIKILSRGGTDNLTRNCLGTLISTSLVLTSPKCIKELKEGDEPRSALREFLVIMTRPGGDFLTEAHRRQHFLARLADNGNTWALLQIRPLDIRAACPPAPAPKRIAPLSIHPSLVVDDKWMGASSTDGSLDTGVDALRNCFVLGFETSRNADDFGRSERGQRFMRVDVEQLLWPIDDGTISMVSASEESGARLYRSRISQNVTACFDDTGAPLFCELPSADHYGFGDNDDYGGGVENNAEATRRFVQVGMFQSLGFLDDVTYDPASIEMCTLADEMQFTLLDGDADFVEAIQRLAFSEFASTYVECGFNEFANRGH